MQGVYFSGAASEFCPSKISPCSIVIRILKAALARKEHQSTRVLGMGVEQALCLVNPEALPQ
jgi:hypothetical protein